MSATRLTNHIECTVCGRSTRSKTRAHAACRRDLAYGLHGGHWVATRGIRRWVPNPEPETAWLDWAVADERRWNRTRSAA